MIESSRRLLWSGNVVRGAAEKAGGPVQSALGALKIVDAAAEKAGVTEDNAGVASEKEDAPA